jgi:amidase
VSIKDPFAAKGIRTTWGSRIYKDHVPTEDDLVVQRLKAAGAIMVGKTNTPEYGDRREHVRCRVGRHAQPLESEAQLWRLKRRCGGRGGWAWGPSPKAQTWVALSGCQWPFAASWASARRRVSSRHPRTLIWDTLGVNGPIARTVADVALMLAAMAGPDDRAPLSYAVETTRFPLATKAP